MDNGLKVRQILFESLLEDGENRENWEKLCCSDRPLVPFVGAGISAWCYPTWNNLLKDIVEKVYSPQCAEIVQEVLACKTKPDLDIPTGTGRGYTFRWMEEIAECIFETRKKDYEKYINIFQHTTSNLKDGNLVLHKLRSYVGKEAENKKVEAGNELYEAFSEAKLKEKGKMPEYQNLFFRLFPDVLVTTNYDKALESCYNSILSYSYKDLGKKRSGKKSWLFRAIIGKLDARQQELDGREKLRPDVTIPRMPMLLKVHGSIEQANDIALSWSGYERAYRGEMPELFREIANKSTVIFLGCGMRDDRILGELDYVRDKDLYAFLPKWEENKEKEEEEQKELLRHYGIRPIYYDKRLMSDGMQGEDGLHDFFLGLLLENLDRRRIFYPKALEELWDEDRFDRNSFLESELDLFEEEADASERNLKRKNLQIERLREKSRSEWLRDGEPQYVHREQAQEIWDLLNTSAECPLIAIIGDVGAGKSFLCRSIQELHKSYKDTMQFFYISMDGCRTWEEFGLRLYEGLNIMAVDIPEEQEWRKLAECISERCGVYWRSVLILDQMEKIQESAGGLWETIKTLLRYWKENHTRVIFVCRTYPHKISCHTWQIEHLQKQEAYRVFQSACQAMRNREISSQERDVVNTLFDKQIFQASEVSLLGKYADSKSNLSSFLEEWDLYYKPGDKVKQTLARMLWNNLLAEHCCADQPQEQQKNIKENILWIWGILEKYPGNFPHQFFEFGLEKEQRYKAKQLSEKTLMYMKNYGLCEEVTDEKQNNILNNMIICVEENFVSELDEDLKRKFYQFKDSLHSQGQGMVWFRGYYMNSYERGLRNSIVQELKAEGEMIETSDRPVNDILELLKVLGKQVEESEKRIRNAELDVILHYEVKAIVQILRTYLTDKELQDHVFEISENFYSYYHYIPNYAASFVRQLIEEMENRENYSKVSIAKMCKVMGDIQRLQGKRDEAEQSYEKALRLCDNLILSEFGKGPKRFSDILHIKAGILLARNYYRNSEEDSDEAENIYLNSKDEPGQAYFNQYTAEARLAEYGRKRRTEKETKERSVEIFEATKKYFLEALRLYRKIEEEKEENTRIAYMLKCIGDLIVEFKEDVWEQGYCVKYDMHDVALEIVQNRTYQKGNEADGKDWFHAASDYYLQAFIGYCHHINWRGLANVLQAMGTCYRCANSIEIRERSRKVENIYNLAEECYRWLGDVRGLADTLDYFGHYYNGIREECGTGKIDDAIVTEKNVLYKYMALSKWKESRKVWGRQGNSDKAGSISGYVELLEGKIKLFEGKDKSTEDANKESEQGSVGAGQA